MEKAKALVNESTEAVNIHLSLQFVQAVASAGGDLTKLQRSEIKYRPKRAQLVLEKSVFASCFEKPLEQISSHVRDVLKIGGIQFMIVVGGFAESPLLIERLIKEFNFKCRVIRPVDPSLAILKSALMFGQGIDGIPTRFVQYAYGIEMWHPFDASKGHPEKLKIRRGGNEYCENIFLPLVGAGEGVKIGQLMERKCRFFLPDQKGIMLNVFRSSKIVQCTTGLEQLLFLAVIIPGASKLLDPWIKVQFYFSKTRLHVTTWGVDSPSEVAIGVVKI